MKSISRRKFIAQAACGAGLAGAVVARRSLAGESRPAPFAYDVGKYAKTDPKLIGFEEIGRFAAGIAEPRRIAGGNSERLHVAGAKGVAVLGKEGTKLSELSVPNARCAAAATDGTIYVGARDHIEVFDGKGKRLAVWESPGAKAWLTGIDVSADDIFAAESAGRVILRYDRSGKVIGRIGQKDKERNSPGLIVPSPYLDVAVAPDGLLRVNNPGRHRVELYTRDGDFEGFWGKPSAAIDGFCGCCNPIAVAMLTDGRCITCEKGLPRVKLFSAEGKFESVVAGPESFPQNARAGSARDLSDGTLGGLDAAVDAAGTVYVLDLVAGDVHVFKRKARV